MLPYLTSLAHVAKLSNLPSNHEIQSDSIALLKKDDDYLKFIVSLSTSIQSAVGRSVDFEANITEYNTFACMKITDPATKMR